jgi:glycosyltransferase involved in cell wall biosynthesis
MITTDMPGCRDTVIPALPGFLCPSYGPDRLAEAMTALMTSRCLNATIGREGRRLAVTRFDRRLIVAQTLAFYERCLNAADKAEEVHRPSGRSNRGG